MKVHTVSDKIRFIEKCFGRGRLAANGKNFDIWCPLCNEPDRGKKKLAIRVEDDKNHCWVCGWRARTLVPLLRKFGSQEELNEYVETFLSGTEYERRRRCIIVDDDGVKRELTLPNDFKLVVTNTETRDPDVVAAQKYLFMQRGLTERDLWYYKLGTSNQIRWHRRVLMPSFDATGRLNYFVGRAIDRHRKPKYDSPAIDKLPIVFNEINVDWSRPLVLCEGPFDLVKCGDNATPLLGSNINEESLLFERIIVNRTPTIIALDANMMEYKVPWMIKKFQEYSIDVKVVDVRLYGKEDPGEMSKDEFAEAVANASVPTWNELLKNKLRRASRVTLSRHT